MTQGILSPRTAEAAEALRRLATSSWRADAMAALDLDTDVQRRLERIAAETEENIQAMPLRERAAHLHERGLVQHHGHVLPRVRTMTPASSTKGEQHVRDLPRLGAAQRHPARGQGRMVAEPGPEPQGLTPAAPSRVRRPAAWSGGAGA